MVALYCECVWKKIKIKLQPKRLRITDTWCVFSCITDNWHENEKQKKNHPKIFFFCKIFIFVVLFMPKIDRFYIISSKLRLILRERFFFERKSRYWFYSSNPHYRIVDMGCFLAIFFFLRLSAIHQRYSKKNYNIYTYKKYFTANRLQNIHTTESHTMQIQQKKIHIETNTLFCLFAIKRGRKFGIV